MPCRLNDGLHEWRNEIVTVPTKNLLNTLSRCKSRGLQVGSKDPVELYCSLLLWSVLLCSKELRRKRNTCHNKTGCLSLNRETVVGGQFGWGGTLLKRYQQGPMVDSVGLEIRRRV